jgi:hypothetical protein
MKIYNTQYYRDVDFDDYRRMPGISYSSLRDFNGEPTPAMSLGTKVHQFLLEPHMYKYDDIAVVKPIAVEIRNYLGEAFSVFEKELSFTATFTHNGMMMPYKGRADLIKVGKLLVDIKVSNMYLHKGVAHFGYEKQLAGYCLATGTVGEIPNGLAAIIVSYNKVTRRVERHLIKREDIVKQVPFWEYQVARNGVPIAQPNHEYHGAGEMQ